ncbi:MAG: ChaN family lipoprotein [Gammaproteobacteria bacterium]|jgi:uncharacterized iron-regulated protein|nr:ChaN family lipoprotein [Gammaproteobacteria bacterium]
MMTAEFRWRHAGPLFLFAAITVIVSACAGPGSRHSPHADHPGAMAHPPAEHGAELPLSAMPALALSGLPTLAETLPALRDHRIVYIGEIHDRYSHHLTQLEIIRYLHQADPRLAIGVEFFQAPFQARLDAYIAGEIDERELLTSAQYFKRWGYDYRLYAPIMRYAREHGLPLVALSAPAELVDAVRERGMDGLTAAELAALPAQLDRSDREYEGRMRQVFHMHAHGENGVDDFERFVQIQLLWDEVMARHAADYLRKHADRRLVILAGSGHIAFRSGIPRRVQRQVGIEGAVVLIGWAGPLAPGLGDYLLLPQERALPPAGRMGAFLDDDEKGVRVRSCAAGSACEELGIQRGDRLLAVNGKAVDSVGGVRALLWDRSPGERISISLSRERLLLPPEERELELDLR